MPEHEARERAFYDHETEEPRLGGRRRRPVADWGVGEDVFDRMPSRRFARPDHVSGEPRGHGRDHRRAAEAHAGRRFAAADEPPDGEGRTIVAGGEVEHGARRTIVASGDVEHGAGRTIVASGDVVPSAGDDGRGAPQRDGRRTVVISGHPDRLPAPRPRRPPRTAVERVGARPDRIVAYAVAMGFLLIVIAILTTGQ